MKYLKPISNSRRNTVLVNFKKKLESTVKKYPKKLFVKINAKSGRGAEGTITTRHKGGGHKKIYRVIDFKRYKKDGMVGKVKSIEYDPYRNCFISFISYSDGSSSFIINPDGLNIGDEVVSSPDGNIPIKPGNNTSLAFIPVGSFIHNIEMKPLKGGQIARSAGSFAQVMGKDETGRYIILKLMSKETRKILSSCRATIGRVGNESFSLVKLGKAGRNRWRGVRPTVRGSAMNPIDHPHGGGENKTPIGRKPVSYTGKTAIGGKTRRNKKSDKFIVRSRRQQKKVR